MRFKREPRLVTLGHGKGLFSLGIDYDSTTQLCLRKRPFSTSNQTYLLIPGEKSGLEASPPRFTTSRRNAQTAQHDLRAQARGSGASGALLTDLPQFSVSSAGTARVIMSVSLSVLRGVAKRSS